MIVNTLGKTVLAGLAAGAMTVALTAVSASAHPTCKDGGPNPCPVVPPALVPDETGCRDVTDGAVQSYTITEDLAGKTSGLLAFNIVLGAASCADAHYEAVVRAPDATFLAEELRPGDGTSSIVRFAVSVPNPTTCVAIDVMVRQRGVTHDIAPDSRDYSTGTSHDVCAGDDGGGAQTWR